MASSDLFEITFNGLAGHAAHPHTAIDVVTGATDLLASVAIDIVLGSPPVSWAVEGLTRSVQWAYHHPSSGQVFWWRHGIASA